MKRSSLSLKRMPSYSVEKGSSVNVRVLPAQRLVSFPSYKDSNFVTNVGRKHYQNHSDKLLKLLKPEKHPYEHKFQRKASQPEQPHMIPESSQRVVATEPDSLSPAKKKEGVSLRGKLTDELDRMRVQLQQKKQVKPYAQPLTMISDYPSVPSPQKHDYALYNEKPQSRSTKIDTPARSSSNNSYSLPKISSSSSSLLRDGSSSNAYYNPQQWARYDKQVQQRSRNPTHLSTILGII